MGRVFASGVYDASGGRRASGFLRKRRIGGGGGEAEVGEEGRGGFLLLISPSLSLPTVDANVSFVCFPLSISRWMQCVKEEP